MKEIFIIIASFLILCTSCETDFDVNSKWQETTVVYGILDASIDTQYVKVSKAFLGEMDALQMAQYSDSINYGIDELDVWIYKSQFNQIKDSIKLSAVLSIRDGEIFNDTILLYTFINSSSFLQNGHQYDLVIFNIETGNVVSSTTNLVEIFSFDYVSPKWRFDPDATGLFRFESVPFSSAKNAEIYQLIVRIHYTENNENLYLDWVQPLDDSNDDIILEGEKFFAFLQASKQLEVNSSNISRSLQSIDLYLTAGTEDLNTYMQVNEPITGVVQQRPTFTNINNGIGLFTSRYSITKEGIELDYETKKYVRDNLDLNFE